MWYSGSPDGSRPRGGRATSKDGFTWQKDSLNPIFKISPATAWDDAASFAPYVLADSLGYTMWYAGWKGQNYGATQIGRATSINGRSWQKDSLNPVLAFGSTSEWDASYLLPETVIFDGSKYKIWYMGGRGGGFPTTSGSIGYATSPDGINWTKYAQNPILKSGPSGSWDNGGIGLCGVIYDSGYYRMWYEGNIINYHNDRMGGLGYAVSEDGINWKKYPGNPVIPSTFSSWTQSTPNGPTLIRSGNELRMWYSAFPNIGYATSKLSPPLITFPDSLSFNGRHVNDTLSITIGNWGYFPLKPLIIDSLYHLNSNFTI